MAEEEKDIWGAREFGEAVAGWPFTWSSGVDDMFEVSMEVEACGEAADAVGSERTVDVVAIRRGEMDEDMSL